MPKELTPYYIDKFDLTSESGCEQKLSLFGLINMDEFDKYRAGQMPALKNLMQMTTLTSAGHIVRHSVICPVSPLSSVRPI